MYRRPDSGWIEVICGPMFSGKSEELIRRVTRSRIARIPVQTFKPAIDIRYADHQVVSHSALSVEAQPVADSDALIRAVEDATVVVGIDEGQFFDDGLVEVCESLAAAHKQVIVAGSTSTTCSAHSNPSQRCADAPNTSPRCWRCATAAEDQDSSPSAPSAPTTWWCSEPRTPTKPAAATATTRQSRNSRRLVWVSRSPLQNAERRTQNAPIQNCSC
jgi:hypothetical protein